MENSEIIKKSGVSRRAKQTLAHLEHDRLAKECANLDPYFEQEMADMG